ncbi:hypothetical protein FNF31_07023 [Cafeteria roenbergensis]|uniref:Uncharacterized protein n=1 Tax=Cafeteria roenbergensis TaxID=33653 RepID=A0A5A8CBM0_CAFRO|nr:hypothetical protein FNF31_07023 [Cafeteria roenbergensis]
MLWSACSTVFYNGTGDARSVPVRPLSSAAPEAGSQLFSTDTDQWAADNTPREFARRDAVGLALGTLSLSFASPKNARARVELGQDHFEFIVEMAAAKGLRSADNEDIIPLLGRLGTASIELSHCTDIDAVLQHARVTLDMPGGKAQLAKWHRLGHLQSVAGGFAEVMVKPSTIATVQEHAKKLLLKAEEQEKRVTFVTAMSAVVEYSSSCRQSGQLAGYDELQAAKLAWKSLRTAQTDPRLSLFLGTYLRTDVACNAVEGIFDLAFRERRRTSTNVKLLFGPKGSGKTTLVWEAAKAVVNSIPSSCLFDVVVVKIDGSGLQSVVEAADNQGGFVPHPAACVQFALWQAGLLRGTRLERNMESNPWDPRSWVRTFDAVISGATSTVGRKVRIFLIMDEILEFYKSSPMAQLFRTQLTGLMNAVPDFETIVMVSSTIGLRVLLSPESVLDDPRIHVYKGLEGHLLCDNAIKITYLGNLQRFTGDQAVRFMLSCLPELRKSTLSDIPRIVNELRGELHAEPPANAEQLDQLRNRPAWKFKELSKRKDFGQDARVEAERLVDLGILHQAEPERFRLSSNFMRLLSLRVLDEMGSCGLHPRQILAMLDATGASGEAMELLAVEGILQLLPPLKVEASDSGQPLPMDKFFKEKPDKLGADAVAVVELDALDGSKTRHIIRVQAKVSSGQGLHPFKSEANGVPVYVVPIVADHEVMLDVWPARVKKFASATGIKHYSKPMPKSSGK